MREYFNRKQRGGNGGNRAQSLSVSLIEGDAPRAAISGACRGMNRLYALNNFQEQEDPPDVVTSMIGVFNFTFYALLDQWASSSFVTSMLQRILKLFVSNIANHLVFPHLLVNPF